MKKRIALLGSTGSIGVQTLEVVSCFPEHFEVEVLTAHSNTELLIQQAKQFQPNCVVIADETQYQRVKEALWSEDIKVYAGANALCDVVEMSTVDVVVAAIVGVAGLAPVYRAICAGKPIALANKETLVVAGEHGGRSDSHAIGPGHNLQRRPAAHDALRTFRHTTQLPHRGVADTLSLCHGDYAAHFVHGGGQKG